MQLFIGKHCLAWLKALQGLLNTTTSRRRGVSFRVRTYIWCTIKICSRRYKPNEKAVLTSPMAIQRILLLSGFYSMLWRKSADASFIYPLGLFFFHMLLHRQGWYTCTYIPCYSKKEMNLAQRFIVKDMWGTCSEFQNSTSFRKVKKSYLQELF